MSRHGDERSFCNKVNEHHKRLVREGKIKYTSTWSFSICSWDDNDRDFSCGKLSAIGRRIADTFCGQRLPSGTYDPQMQFCGPNHDTEFLPLPTSEFQTMTTDADGKNPRIAKADGSKIMLSDQLDEAGARMGAALGTGVTVSLGLGDPDIIDNMLYKLKVMISRVDDITNDDVGLRQCPMVRSYGSGSGCDSVAVLLGGFGTNFRMLDAPYGGKTMVRPSRDVGGKRYEFDLLITPMVDSKGKAVDVGDAGKEDRETAQRASSKGLSVELPIGPTGCMKMTTFGMGIIPIKKIGPPPPTVDKSSVYVKTDPLSLVQVYMWNRSDGRYVFAPTSEVLAHAGTACQAVVSIHNIIGYTPSTTPIELPQVYVTMDPVSGVAVYSKKWTNDTFHRVYTEYAANATLAGAPAPYRIIGYTPAPAPQPPVIVTQLSQGFSYTSLGGLRSIGAAGGPSLYRSLGGVTDASANAPPADEEEEDDDDDEVKPCYRSQSAVVGAEAVPSAYVDGPASAPGNLAVPIVAAAAAPESLPVDEEEPVDVSNDAAIANALGADEAPALPVVGAKRSLSAAEAEVEKPLANVSLVRQQRDANSTGVQPTVVQNLVRDPSCPITFTQVVQCMIEFGKEFTDADLINLDENVGKLYEKAKAASGVSGTKKLSGAYAAAMSATSSKPMSLSEKCDVQATMDASANGQIAVGIPMGMEGLF